MANDSMDGKDPMEGTNGTANSDGSNPEGSKQSSNAVADTARQLKQLQDQVAALTRSLQSDKDKAVARTNQRIDRLEGDIKSVLQTALKNGQSVQDILSEVEQSEEQETREALRELATAYRKGQFPNGDSRGSDTSGGVDVTKVIDELGLSSDDVRVQEFASRQFKSDAEAYREAAKLLKSIATKQPSEADLPSSLSKGQSAGSKTDALQREYNERSANLRGQALINLKMEMRKKGLNIY